MDSAKNLQSFTRSYRVFFYNDQFSFRSNLINPDSKKTPPFPSKSFSNLPSLFSSVSLAISSSLFSAVSASISAYFNNYINIKTNDTKIIVGSVILHYLRTALSYVICGQLELRMKLKKKKKTAFFLTVAFRNETDTNWVGVAPLKESSMAL